MYNKLEMHYFTRFFDNEILYTSWRSLFLVDDLVIVADYILYSIYLQIISTRQT